MIRLFLRTALLSGLCALLQAHDFWIEPSVFQPKPGDTVALRFRVGEHFRGDEIPRDPSRVLSFRYWGPKGSGEIPGMTGYGPAGVVAISDLGLYLAAFHSTSSFVELDAEAFESYLREEGLERVIEERKKHGESQELGKEFFARCVKSILRAGSGGSAEGFDRVLDFPVELVPDNNPYALQGGGGLSVRLLRQGKPLEGALVVAYADADPSEPLKARTDEQGRVVLSLNRTGPWLVKAVHMERINDDEADWQSWWASLTFEVP